MSFVFRGDDGYLGGSIGREFGAEADAADIQNLADPILRKESNRSSRFTSFTEEVKIARKFTSASDNRHVYKVEWTALLELEVRGAIRIWTPDRVYTGLLVGSRRDARQASDVRTAMTRNNEVLIEGQILAEAVQRTI
jgi:hypothetical protein